MSVGDQADGVTPLQPDLEEFPEATARNPWTGDVTIDRSRAWFSLAPAPGMICLIAGPEGTTLLQQQDAPGDRGALMMTPAAGEEQQGAEEEEEAGLTNLPITQNTSQDRNQDHGGMSTL